MYSASRLRVQLVDSGAGKLLDQPVHVEAAGHRQHVDHPPRDPQEGQVDAHPFGDPRLQDLDDDFVAVGEHGAVHLRQRRRCDRLGLEHHEHIGERPSQLLLDHPDDLRGGHRRQRVEQLAELLGVVGSEEVVPRGQQLSDLHVAATAGLEVPAQDARPARRSEEATEQERGGSQQAQDEEPGEPGDREDRERDAVAHGRPRGSLTSETQEGRAVCRWPAGGGLDTVRG